MKPGLFFLYTWANICLTGSSTELTKRQEPLQWRASVVHNNPGEGLTATKYSNPDVVKDLGYNIMVKSDGQPPHAAIDWEAFDPTFFPSGSAGREWVDNLAGVIDSDIKAMHDRGLKAMYWFDMFMLPRAFVNKYGANITDSRGRWSLDSPFMVNITRYMLDAVFTRFPDLDGLLVRTGEIYTQDVPYHVGSSPIPDGARSHVQLLQILHDVVIDKHNKLLWYRTWSFDGFHSDPSYYLSVTNQFEPHPNLLFVIKHTQFDFLRTVNFNPTLGVGKHTQLLEIQCQREYESKGATPNYVMNGVINGFEEYNTSTGLRGAKDLLENPLFQGVVIWNRGGGWMGPYPADEFWIDMNVRVITAWAQNPTASEEVIFDSYAKQQLQLDGPSRHALRQVALLSARGVLFGHYSVANTLSYSGLFWTRDWYIGGSDSQLATDFKNIIARGLVEPVLDEKAKAVELWNQVGAWAAKVKFNNPALAEFVHHSITYGQLLYRIIAASWVVTLNGMSQNATGNYDLEAMREGIRNYDESLALYGDLTKINSTGRISSLYTPYQFGSTAGPHAVFGANNSVNSWRWVTENNG